uniref:Uncharacterized protein n=1 Tax=Oryza punctata TaxID=4537 RepID=A0A0E0LKR9_ORYPU
MGMEVGAAGDAIEKRRCSGRARRIVSATCAGGAASAASAAGGSGVGGGHGTIAVLAAIATLFSFWL